MNYSDAETFEAHQRIGDALVELGLAKTSMFDRNTMKGEIALTARGLALRHELAHAYEMLARDKSKAGVMDFVGLLMFMARESRAK